MVDRILLYLFDKASQYRRTILTLVLAITAASVLSLPFVRYEGGIDVMLPPDPEITRSMNFLRESNLSDKIVISLALNDPERSRKDLFSATDQLAASLTPPLFTKVLSGFSEADALEEFSVLRYAPQMLSAEDLAGLDAKITPESVDRALRGIFLQSLRPESIFFSSLSRTDPLNIKVLLLAKLRAVPASMGYDVGIEEGHFISRDGLHTLLIVQTPVSMLDGQGSQNLLKALQDRIARLPSQVSAIIVGGHLHTVSNEQVIKRDIRVATTITSLAFLLLFFLVFRDLRAVFVFVIPLFAVIWAIMTASGIEGSLSYLVVGLGTAIAGIATDYGLLIYTAVKNGADRARMVKVARLVAIDAFTTIFSFAALYFSAIRGYHQLALFSILAVLICLLFSVFVLPLVLPRSQAVSPAVPADAGRVRMSRSTAVLAIGVWIVLTGIAFVLASGIRFESDVKKLDGADAAVLAQEQDFHRVWGGTSNQAIFVVQGSSSEEAMEKNDAVYRDAAKVLGPEEFTSIALFWSSQKLRSEQTAQWDRFWKEGREQKLKRLIADKAPRYGFSGRAFAPFFEGLYLHDGTQQPEGLIAKLQERFVIQTRDRLSVLSFFPDEPRAVAVLSGIAQNHPGSFIVSGRSLSSSISLHTSREAKILVPIAVLFNVILAVLFFRNWTEALISLVPVLTGVVWLVGIMAVFHTSLNIVNVVVLIVMTGVIVDYGLGVTFEYRSNLRTGTVLAVTLSAITNIMGAGALLFAKHPVLHSTGLAMVICTITGYLSSVLVIPAFCSLLPERVDNAGIQKTG